MSADEMHSNAAGAADVACGQCGKGFKPRTRWQRFCSVDCRNGFHRSKSAGEDLNKRVAALEEQVAMIRAHFVL